MGHVNIQKKNEVYLQLSGDIHILYELADRFTFDGSDDFLEAASNYSSDIVTIAATFVAWIRRDGTQSNWAGFMFDREGNSICGMHFHEDEHTIGNHRNNSSNTWSWES